MIARESIKIMCPANARDCADPLCPGPHDPLFVLRWSLPYNSRMNCSIHISAECYASDPLQVMEMVREHFLHMAGDLWRPCVIMPV